MAAHLLLLLLQLLLTKHTSDKPQVLKCQGKTSLLGEGLSQRAARITWEENDLTPMAIVTHGPITFCWFAGLFPVGRQKSAMALTGFAALGYGVVWLAVSFCLHRSMRASFLWSVDHPSSG
jgi:hypothetical protein